MAKPHVVIIGGGFGGLNAAKKLARAPVELTLLDRRNHHLFQPLLYQVATAALNPSDIAYPIRGALRKQRNARVLLADARAIDVARRRVELDAGAIDYDYLIVATGATHSYFGRDEWAAHAPGLKTVEDALDIRRRVYLAYEAAEREQDPARRRDWLTFAVVGAGPTGVELAGALAEIGRHTLVRDFRAIDPRSVRVILLEGMDRVLPGYPVRLSDKAEAQLTRLGVEVRTGAMVTHIDGEGLNVAGGRGDGGDGGGGGAGGAGEGRIGARTVLWAAGVQASPLARSLGVPLDRAGRVQVEPDLTIPDHPEVFVIGDLAAATTDGVPVPGMAQGALQGGACVADNIQRALRGAPHRPFRYRDRGTMATIGRAAAVVDLGRFQFSGLFAWMFWWVVHILFLIGFRNRILVMFSWAWSYVTFQRGARLITGPLPALPAVDETAPAEPGEPAQAADAADAAQADAVDMAGEADSLPEDESFDQRRAAR